MADIPGLKGDVFFGEDAELPDWREELPEDEDDEEDEEDDDEITDDERAALIVILGFDPRELDA